MIDTRILLEMAKQVALEAGRVIMRVYLQNDFDVQLKSDQSPLTIADKQAHASITHSLASTNYPILSEEEGQVEFAARKAWEYFWMIDPLDGTKEFITGSTEFTVNIAFIHGNKPIIGVIYAPATETLYAGGDGLGVKKIINGEEFSIEPLEKRLSLEELKQKQKITIVISRSHLTGETKNYIAEFPNAHILSKGSSLKFMMLIEGEADLYPRLGTTMEWDIAAAHAILNASNRGIYKINFGSELNYNKKELSNPYFIAF